MMWPTVDPRYSYGTLVEHCDDGKLGHIIGWEGYDDDAQVHWICDDSVAFVPAMDLMPIVDPTAPGCAHRLHVGGC